ncbi:unnamed protein product, partial [marine sediment metagenome]
IILTVVGLIFIGPTLIAEITGGDFSIENALASIFLTKYGIGGLFCLVFGIGIFLDMRKKISEL